MLDPLARQQKGVIAAARVSLPCNLSAAAILAWGILGGSAHGAVLYNDDGFDVRWDNTLRYSAGVRLGSANTRLLSYLNSDDGDQNFSPGLMSNRLDLMSVLNIASGDFGIQASVQMWYDAVYHSRTDNKSPITYNPRSVPNTQFTRAVKNLDGQHLDLGNTFVYGNFTIAGAPVSMRLGRQTLVWGESLFFEDNGIAAAQAPVDYLKSASTPNGYSKRIFLPINQLSVTVQPLADLSLAAYYQLEWRKSRIPSVGSYFSGTDLQGAGAERAFLAQGQFLSHGVDQTPSAGGQFGVSLEATINDFDLGFYALRYHAKYPVLKAALFSTPVDPSGPVGEFYSVYPTGIDVYGASFSAYIGDSNIAGEVSLRRNMPLVSISPVSLYFAVPFRTVIGNGYAKGDTLHAQVSGISTLSPTPLWERADLSIEFATNYLLDATSDGRALNPFRDRYAASVQALFQPHYFEVLPNLDASLNFGIRYNFMGRSSVDYAQISGTGQLEVGISASYFSAWRADLSFTSFFGAPDRQPLADRDFMAISIERAF